jgi:hypothetical protein
MHIGLIAPPGIPVPPPAYGGTESVVDRLARGLVRAGHEVLRLRCPGTHVRRPLVVAAASGSLPRRWAGARHRACGRSTLPVVRGATQSVVLPMEVTVPPDRDRAADV